MGIFSEHLSKPMQRKPAKGPPKDLGARAARAAERTIRAGGYGEEKARLVRLVYAQAARNYQRYRDEELFGLRPRRGDVQTRWAPDDTDELYKELNATGNLYRLGLFLDAMRRDGTITGLMRTLTSGLLRLPVQFSGDAYLTSLLRGKNAVYDQQGHVTEWPHDAEFWRLFPEAELGAVMFDGYLGGIGIGEFKPQKNGLPRLRHLDISGLLYNFTSDTWGYRSQYESWAVEPGDGRWFVFTPWGAYQPWKRGLWWPCALPFVSKLGSTLDRMRWQASMADALKWVRASGKASPGHLDDLERFINEGWFLNPAIVLEEGEEVGLIESGGEGYQTFKDGEDQGDKQIIRALVGQEVTTLGGSGWSDGSAWLDILHDLVASFAEALATTVHDDGLVPWAELRGHGPEFAPWARWDIRSPKKRVADAEALGKYAASLKALDEVHAPRGERVDIPAMNELTGFVIPTQPIAGKAPTGPAQPVIGEQ